ncbi:putative porin [Cellulophaga baltica]|uniref:putative porin n=1 Tax=Cellulophaga TaxID=104264 RepID=UPI001C06D3C3|nr:MULTISPECIES: putative porin [Cellulophaga]MBU2995332.1 putative porin [Cellulophaga baltica]MDO6766727.1 putative porin [Cellulophaga sp. 1_MG-2023]
MRYLFLVIFILIVHLGRGQQQGPKPKPSESDSIAVTEKPDKELGKLGENGEELPIVSDYKIISFARDTTFVDTTLTINKDYLYNYIRKDNYELLPFANMGQPYNKLGYDFETTMFYPKLGATAKHYNYFEMEDINYYHVPTPMTEAMFKTVFEEGQLLDVLLTFNISERLNYMIAYKGFRSYGKYNYSEAISGNFRTSASYRSKNNRYSLRIHIAAQDIDTEENGGLSETETQFASGDDDFNTRTSLDVNLTDAENTLIGKRYFIENQYKLIRKEQDSSAFEKTTLALGHLFNYETKNYKFNQDDQDDYFGDAFLDSDIADRANLKTMYNQLSAELYDKTLGRLKGNLNIYSYNYFFNSLLTTSDGTQIDHQLKGTEVSIGADYKKKIGGFILKGNMSYNISGDLTGSLLNATAGYKLNDDLEFSATLFSSSKMPDFNYLLYQSDYSNYNWQHSDDFEKVNTNSLQFDVDSKLFGEASVKFTSLDNYTYFAVDPDQTIAEDESENQYVQPYQESDAVSYLKVKFKKAITYKNFTLDNTLMYQSVSQTNSVLNVPQFTTRNSLFYSKEIFKKAMYIQTGFTFKYFTSYNMNSYNPLLGEFYIQTDEDLGGFPLMDFFINAKVKQTRIFLKAEHFNSMFSAPNYYSAPDYPYRDFIVRFGVVWNFFS